MGQSTFFEKDQSERFDMILERLQVSVLTSVADKVDPRVSKNQNAVSVLISRKFDRKLKVLKEYGER